MRLTFALPLLFVFLWSTGYIGAALVAPFSEPFSILTFRFLGAGICLFTIGLFLGGNWPSLKRLALIFASGILIHGLYLCGVFWGIKGGMPAGISALMIGLQPILTAILASILLGDKIHTKHWLGLVIGLSGLALVIYPKLSFEGTGIPPFTLPSHIIAVLGIVLGSLFQKRYIGIMDFKKEPFIQQIGGLSIALPIALMTESFHFTFTPELIISYLWMTLILSCGAFVLYVYLLQSGTATKVASLFYLIPVLSAVQGYLFFGEILSSIQLAGMAVTTAAVALASDIFIKSGHAA